VVREQKMDSSYAKKISDKKIIHQLINFTMKHRRLMQNYLDETGVYQAQHHLLMEIARNPRASQKDIARLMDVSAATVAVSLKKLEKGGYIKREVDEKDNRLNKITITERGNKVVEKSKEIFAATDRKVLAGFTEEEKHTLFVLLQKLNANLVRMEDEEKCNKERT
jgi:DNA-binding MarR family transcriptional regulator